ncbi:MAG: PEGA domain-containing protein [Proteobacteria bacterium]|nr:PEGA domain-containing protein [Pseudomonadota bacterium]
MATTHKSKVINLLLNTLVITAIVIPSITLAEDADKQPTDSERQAEAREQYQRGKDFYDMEDFEEALAAFQVAYDIKPHPVVLKSIAECKVMLGDISTAVKLLEQYISDPASANREAVEQRVTELRGMLATLEVTSEPIGAEIMIDGEETNKVTPASFELGSGDHAVTLNIEGYESIVKNASLESGEESIISVDFATEGTPTVSSDAESAEDEGQVEAAAALEDDGSGPPPVFWAFAAITGVGLVSGTIFGIMAISDEKDYQDNPTNAKQESGKREAIIADVSFGVAGAAAVAGAITLIVHATRKNKESTSNAKIDVMPVAGKNTVGVNAVVSF